MKKLASKALFKDRKIKDLRRDKRPCCGATTRAGGECKAQALINRAGAPGRCRMHGGLSTGPRTRAGKASQRRHAREQMAARWAKMRAEGVIAVQLSDEGRERLRQASRGTMRMRWARQDAAAAAEEMMRLANDIRVRGLASSRQQVIMQPYLTALERGGAEEFYDLAEVAGFDLRNAPDGTELAGMILARYAPAFDIGQAATDLMNGAR
jgi:hypothetical protein